MYVLLVGRALLRALQTPSSSLDPTLDGNPVKWSVSPDNVQTATDASHRLRVDCVVVMVSPSSPSPADLGRLFRASALLLFVVNSPDETVRAEVAKQVTKVPNARLLRVAPDLKPGDLGRRICGKLALCLRRRSRREGPTPLSVVVPVAQPARRRRHHRRD